MDTSELLNLLLSSAVIVALIEWISKNKANYLQHITNNRAEWRKSLKNISAKLYNSNKDTIGSVFAELKVNLNSYGLHPSGNYPPKIQLDYFKDEHLWAEMDEVQTNLSSMSSKEFVQKKERMIEMISLLLKFDWERSKREVRSKFIVPLGLVLYLCPLLFINKNVLQTESIPAVISLLVSYFLFWSPFFIYSYSIFRHRHWYNEYSLFLLSWGIAIFFLLQAADKIPKRHFSIVFFILTLLIIFSYILDFYQMYLHYEQALLEFYPYKLVVLASHFNSWTTLVLMPFLHCFSDYNIKIDDKKFAQEFFWTSEFQLILSKLSSESIIKKDSDILKIRSRVWYYFKKKSNFNLCVSDFIAANPKRCRMIIKFCSPSNTAYTLCSPLRNKQYWKSWMN